MNQAAIGSYIARKRREENLTQEQLAERLGVSNKTVSKWENGKCMPDYGVVQWLCGELHVTLPELMDGEDAAQKGQNYLYPHDYPGHWVKQQYLPDALAGVRYYEYGQNKNEQAAKAYWDKIKK